jgi:uncharacterized membrane protein
VSPRFLLGVFDPVYVIALTAWVGSTLFFSFGVAPLIFTALSPEAGGKFVRALFRRYYTWGTIAGATALPAYVAVPLCYPEYRGAIVGIQAMIILGSTLIMLYTGNSLTPAINAARDAGPEGHERLERLHRRSVRLNGLVLLGGLGLLVAFANRPATRTSGITELSPSERARFDAELDQVIEQVESKYGFRTPRAGQEAVHGGSGTAVDPEMIREIESYYEQKRLRDLARRRTGPASPQPRKTEQPASGCANTPSAGEAGKG